MANVVDESSLLVEFLAEDQHSPDRELLREEIERTRSLVEEAEFSLGVIEGVLETRRAELSSLKHKLSTLEDFAVVLKASDNSRPR